jgi:hypothetical protein
VVVWFNVFCVVHVGLHVFFRKHREYRFHSWLSWMLILGAGLAGGLDLVLG